MKFKLFTETTFTAKARNAALKYIEKNEFRKTAINMPALLVLVTLAGVFVLLLFAR